MSKYKDMLDWISKVALEYNLFAYEKDEVIAFAMGVRDCECGNPKIAYPDEKYKSWYNQGYREGEYKQAKKAN